MREPRPITHLEISEKHKKLRLIAAIALLIIGVIGITVGIMSALNREAGWQTIQVSTQERSCSKNFQLQYRFEGGSSQVAAENRQLQTVYAQATVTAYNLFTPDELIQGVNNVCYINDHPNREITVDPVLYDAFTQLEGTRWLYLGPVYAHYSNLLIGAEEAYVPQLDPAVDGEAAELLRTMAGFASREDAVRLELLENNRVRLFVSEEYLAYAREQEIENYIDFSYMTNAFIIDYLAGTLADAGLTRGFLVSNDGFTRVLEGESEYSLNLFDRVDNMVYPVGVLRYRGPVSLVTLRNYPTSAEDTRYRVCGDHFVHGYADLSDGMYRASVNDLVSYSYDMGCAQVLLRMLPSFIAGEFTPPTGVYSLWCKDSVLHMNDPQAVVTDLLVQDDIRYTTRLVN